MHNNYASDELLIYYRWPYRVSRVGMWHQPCRGYRPCARVAAGDWRQGEGPQTEGVIRHCDHVRTMDDPCVDHSERH